MKIHAPQRQGSLSLASCQNRHRGLIRCLIFVALFAAAMRSHETLLHREDCSIRRTFQVPSPLLATSARLPSAYRFASQQECISAQSLDFAPASNEPKVSLENQRGFALGGYNLIAKGSGDFNACGPIIALLSAYQHSRSIFGTIAEFGVHHGRFTGFLFITARATEKLIVADLFSQQNKNIDQSGLGNKKSFLKGIMTYGLRPRAIHAVIEASTDELPFDLSRKAKSEPFRLISVDASHTAAMTFNDLQLAFCNLLRGGIVILDDWLHSGWPGVVEGFYQFVHHGPVLEVYPFLICESKLFLTNDRTSYELYYETLRNSPEFEGFITPYVHEKERGKLMYEMLGIKYLKCSSRRAFTVDKFQRLWANLTY